MRRLTASEIDDLANLFLTGTFAQPIELSVEEIAFAAADMGEPYPQFDGQMLYRTLFPWFFTARIGWQSASEGSSLWRALWGTHSLEMGLRS